MEAAPRSVALRSLTRPLQFIASAALDAAGIPAAAAGRSGQSELPQLRGCRARNVFGLLAGRGYGDPA